jgi:hypothetical protein
MVVMAYDDIASDPENPFPGKVYNKPGGLQHKQQQPIF